MSTDPVSEWGGDHLYRRREIENMAAPSQQHCYVHVPETVSQEAQAFLRTLQDPALMPAFPEADDLAGWEKVRAFAEADGKSKSAPLLERYEHAITEGKLGGVPVLDVRPKNWKDNGKVAVYTHGDARLRQDAGDGAMEYGMGPLLRTGPCLDG